MSSQFHDENQGSDALFILEEEAKMWDEYEKEQNEEDKKNE